MSTEKYHVSVTRAGVCFLAGLATVLVAVVDDSAQAADPVLQFYCERAAAVTAARDPVERGLSYSFTARTYYKEVGKRGQIEKTDSTVADYYFSFGSLDSQRTRIAASTWTNDVCFLVPNVFREDYHFNFFPHDTGGSYLAIGFDTDSAGDPRPVGLALIDRERYSLCRLYVFYSNKPGYKRFSRSYRLVEVEGYILPDSIWEVGARQGVFSTDDYRLETGIENITIYR